MRLKSPKTALDVRIMEGVNRGTPIDEVLRDAILYTASQKGTKKLADRSGVSRKTLLSFAHSNRDIMYRNLEDTLYALGYRVTLERI